MQHQVCQICQKNVATIHEYIVAEKRENHICEECYQRLHQEKPGPILQIELLQKLFLPGSWTDKPKNPVETVCPICGMTMSEFKRKGRLGCELCYQTFRSSLDPILESIHDATRHDSEGYFKPVESGTSPHVSQFQEIAALKAQLEDCIKKEDYEKAAEVRDKIKELESEAEDHARGEKE